MRRLMIFLVGSILLLVFSTGLVLARESNSVWKAGHEGVGGDMAALAAQGEVLFADRGCMACHAVRGKGENLGPDLSGIGDARHVRWLKKWLKETHTVVPGARMPQIFLEPDEIDALAVYLSRLTK